MSGRWPSNFCLIHSPGCVRIGVKRVKGTSPTSTRGTYKDSSLALQGAEYILKEMGQPISYSDPDGLETIDDFRCDENCPARKLGEQSGQREVSGTAKLGKDNKAGKTFFGSCKEGHESKMPNDKGTAARFYFQADWSYEQVEWEELWSGK